MKILVFLLLCLIFSSGIAQEKDEREQRIKETEVPASIIEVLEPFTKDLKVKYIFERDGEHSSYEAKFRSKSRFFSVEFDTLGTLEDVEIDVKYKSLDKELKNQIEDYLHKSSTAYKILRCQRQYAHVSGEASQTLKHAINNESHAPINYELEVDMTVEKVLHSYELLFDTKGAFISKRLIINRATDNLLY
ncbi:MAG: hypothetical protein AAF149_12355 [Bacteroidota bacterium]